MTTDEEILDLLGKTLMDDTSTSPRSADVARLRALAAELQVLPPAASVRSRHLLRALATAAAVAAAFTGGMLITRERGPANDSVGVVEFRQELVTNGNGRVDVVGRHTDIGRIVEIRSDAFPILPTGEFYEVWFIAAEDTPTTPRRISAGTFHPDLAGRTSVEMTAAVDPMRYPILAVTAETADGDPRPSQNEVMRGTLTLLD